MYVDLDSHDNCTIYLEKGEHDHQLKWPMKIELSNAENNTLCI